MKKSEILKTVDEIDECLYNLDGVQLDEYDEDLDIELNEFIISYTVDLRDLDKSLDECYKKLENVFYGYNCIDYERIEEIENSFLCINVILKK